MITFQEILRKLNKFWEEKGCIVHQGYDQEVGAGTMNPATFLRCLGPEPYRAAYIEPCRRPADGRYGKNPNRLQHYFQYQVILKPSPDEMQKFYIESLEAIGVDLKKHDIRFVHDDWENPSIGAWGLGWEVWLDGMEITQYTYFQSVGGQDLHPVTGELTYGIERIAIYLQNVSSIFDLKWNDYLTYGDIYHRNEVEFSHYNFENATTSMWFRHFDDYEKEAEQLIEKELPIPAYDFVMKASHAFNILDARGAISTTERTGYIGRMRNLAKMIAESYSLSREKAGHPLLNLFPAQEKLNHSIDSLPQPLLDKKVGDLDDFLLEIGCEELPATFVPLGMEGLKKEITKLLAAEKITYSNLEVFGTPRRLSVLIKEMSHYTQEINSQRKGPQLTKAFDESGKVTAPGQGFFRSLGAQPPALKDLRDGSDQNFFIQEIKGVEYIFAKISQPALLSAKILQKKLAKCILSLHFPKKMHWGDLDITFARPLKWLTCLFGEHIVPFTLEQLKSDRTSYGHRQLDDTSFEISSAKDYEEALKKHFVLADPKARQEVICKGLDNLESNLGAKIAMRQVVLSQVIHLCEWPQVMTGRFDPEFLSVPKEVLISEMVQHQKYFPVFDSEDNLLNIFVITADNTPSDEIQNGNQRVLSARLSDGAFLYQKSLKHPLDDCQEKLEHVTYLKGLGSLYDKVLRLEGHTAALQKMLQISTETKAVRAALLSKSDLVSEMVFEFPDLQGTVGKYLALAQGEECEVAAALEEQWMPLGESASLPQTETGILLSFADKMDNLISCFSAGLKPTSSSDPYALRRQALGIIRMQIEGKFHMPLKQALEFCCRHFIPAHLKNSKQVISDILDFFTNRIRTVFLDFGFEKDEIEASLANGFTDIYDTFCKVEALNNFRKSGPAFANLHEVYKRAKGQLADQGTQELKSKMLKEKAEIELKTALDGINPLFTQAIERQDYKEAYQLIATMQPPLAKLFDEVKILSDDQSVKNNRIALLQQVFGLFSKLLDFSKI